VLRNPWRRRRFLGLDQHQGLARPIGRWSRATQREPAMQRTISRVYKRLRGAHPRRPKSDVSHLLELGCDTLLAAGGLAILGGLFMALWAIFGGSSAENPILGLILVGCGVILLCAWERLAWEPFARQLDELS
jgi:hypothetical protein